MSNLISSSIPQTTATFLQDSLIKPMRIRQWKRPINNFIISGVLQNWKLNCTYCYGQIAALQEQVTEIVEQNEATLRPNAIAAKPSDGFSG
jgi:hypothetical protein